jgi:hypothetical protein
MAINGRKISNFNTLNTLTGNEYLMVAYKGKSYKIPTELLIGNMIQDIRQEKNDGDGADNPIVMTTSDGQVQTFHVYNGKKGSPGDIGQTGPKGQRGDSGIALYNQTGEDFRNLIVNSLDGANFTDEELTQRMLSAAMGLILAEQVKELKEVYLDTQEEFDELERAGQIDEDTKYFIFEE